MAERSIARLLQSDRAYPALGALFAAFALLGATDPLETDDSDLLTRSEETLLDQLSRQHQPDRQYQEVLACQAALRHARIELRPLRAIERSGHDWLMQRIARSYQISMGMLS